MRPETKAFLEAFHARPLFGSVGEPTALVPEPSVGSWKVAAKKCKSKEWSYIQIDTSNILRSNLAAVDMKAFRKWNGIVRSVRPKFVAHVELEVIRAVEDEKLRKSVIDSVNWDILFACMELEYAANRPPRFYERLAAIYLDGHFPCGWHGKYPNAGGILVH